MLKPKFLIPFDADRFHRQAATFDELLSEHFMTRPASSFQRRRAELAILATIREHYAGNTSRFIGRITADGKRLDAIICRLANPAPCPTAPRPEWVVDAPLILYALTRVC